MLDDLASSIFAAQKMPDSLDPAIVAIMAEKLEEAIFEGIGIDPLTVDYDTPNGEVIKSLRSDVWQFSGAKNYRQMKEMTESLWHPDGRFRSFGEFRTSVGHITSDHLNWLKTEYDTAIASSQMAAKWMQIQEDIDLFPVLEFDAVLDNRTTALCRSLDKIRRAVDDPFWDLYYPPNHFNCRSDVEQVRDADDITNLEDIEYPDIPPMFQTNLAKNGLVFPPGHPYYIDLPASVRIQAENLFDIHFRNKK